VTRTPLWWSKGQRSTCRGGGILCGLPHSLSDLIWQATLSLCITHNCELTAIRPPRELLCDWRESNETENRADRSSRIADSSQLQPLRNRQAYHTRTSKRCTNVQFKYNRLKCSNFRLIKYFPPIRLCGLPVTRITRKSWTDLD